MNNGTINCVVICSNTPYDFNPLGAKPLAKAISKKTKVIYVDPPLSYLTVLKQPKLKSTLKSKKLKEIDDNLYHLVPVVLPGKDRPFINRITSLLLKYKVKKAIKTLLTDRGSKPILIATAPHYRVFSNTTYNIYWMMDDYASQPELTGIAESVLSKGQQYLLNNSDKNVFVSKFLLEKYATRNTELIENGADAVLFRFPSHTPPLDEELVEKLPKQNFALYVGGINARIDLELLLMLAKDKIKIAMAGNIKLSPTELELFAEITRHENVVYLGELPNEQLPTLMNVAHVGLVPYKDEPFNNASMPLKIPEYLLCGLTVVSTNLRFTESFEDDDVARADGPEQFSKLVQQALDSELYPSQRVMRSSRIAQQWSWDEKAKKFLNI